MEHTSSKLSARMVADALENFGVEDIVLSPGSRNTPLIIALDAKRNLHKHTVIDERSAAFIALGISLSTATAGKFRPVALVCTSGTAVLNYAPAVAEAYYRGVPLVVISADRPAEWIDQDDSQTIRQTGVLANIVKGSYYLSAENGVNSERWLYNRTLCDALQLAITPQYGPVHINIAFDEPLCQKIDVPLEPEFKIIQCDGLEGGEQIDSINNISRLNALCRIMIIVGFQAYDPVLHDSLQILATHGVAVLYEAQSNLRNISGGVPNIDSTLLQLSRSDYPEKYNPQLVITLGGSLLSRNIKAYLRKLSDVEHWQVGYSDHSIDCFRHLTRRFVTDSSVFMSYLADAMNGYSSEFGAKWSQLSQSAYKFTTDFACQAPWSDLKAMSIIMGAHLHADLHLSNGTCVRYAQLFNYASFSRCECNRGVSGIDGCTSTAVGASLKTNRTVLLISGDMSAQYDMGALATRLIDHRFKMIVFDNAGGGIFRFIKSTGQLDSTILEKYFCADVCLPLRQLAAGFGFEYFEAEDVESLLKQLPLFISSPDKAIFRIITPPQLSAKVLRNYFQQ